MDNDLSIKNTIVEKLIASETDPDFVKLGQSFLETLDFEYEKYDLNIKTNLARWKQQSGSGIYYLPDFLSRLSPVTTLTGAWGNGKTYFIEKIAQNFGHRLIVSKIFKQLMIFDVRKYQNIHQLTETIISKLISGSKKLKLNKKYENILIVKNFFKNKNVSNDNLIFAKNSKNLFHNFLDHEIREQKFLQKINHQIAPTIIFLNNIDQLKQEYHQIFNQLLPLTQLANLVFVLVMSTPKEDAKDHEYELAISQIERYTNIQQFSFEQDYLHLLKSLGFNQVVAHKLNYILSQEIKGQRLSIKEARKRIIKANLSKLDDFLLIRQFTISVWGSKAMASQMIKTYLEKYINYLEALAKIYDRFQFTFKTRKYLNSLAQSPEIKKLIDEQGMGFDPLIDYPKKWSEIITRFKDHINTKTGEINLLEQDKLALEDEISELSKNSNNVSDQINTMEILIHQEKKKSIKDYKEIKTLEQSIESAKTDIENNVQNSAFKKAKIVELEKQINDGAYINFWNDDGYIQELIIEYQKVKSTYLSFPSNDYINTMGLQIFQESQDKKIKLKYNSKLFVEKLADKLLVY